MGVALITSRSGKCPFFRSAHAKTVLFIDDDKGEILKKDVLREKRVGSDDDLRHAHLKFPGNGLFFGGAARSEKKGRADARLVEERF